MKFVNIFYYGIYLLLRKSLPQFFVCLLVFVFKWVFLVYYNVLTYIIATGFLNYLTTNMGIWCQTIMATV